MALRTWELARGRPEPHQGNMLKMQGKQAFQIPLPPFRVFDFDSDVRK
jgi:hypothetical protein